MLDLYRGRIAHYNALMNSLSIYVKDIESDKSLYFESLDSVNSSTERRALHHIDTTDTVEALREKVEHNNKIIDELNQGD